MFILTIVMFIKKNRCLKPTSSRFNAIKEVNIEKTRFVGDFGRKEGMEKNSSIFILGT